MTMADLESRPLFTLAVTAEILGVHPRTLMIYETEKLVIPYRTKTNRRRYSQKDVAKLQFIRYLTTKKGINLAGVEAILRIIEETQHGQALKKSIFQDFSEGKIF